MKIVLFVGTTSTKVGDKEATKFYGGESVDIVEKEAQSLIDQGFAALANSKEAKDFLSKKPAENPKTRRHNLKAETPGLAEKVAVKKAAKDAADKVKADAKAAREKAAKKDEAPAPRRRRPLDDLGVGLNGAAKKED